MPTRLPAALARVPLPAETDAELLARFVRHRDEDAFAALMARHAAMVYGTCRRITGDPHTAEDALQAAFLVLIRKAATLPRPEALAGWLYGVARRVALKARPAPASPPVNQPVDRHPDPLAELTGREVLAVLDEEVVRLPARYRLPVVLCCLEGLTLEEAAARLGCGPGALRGRLERGRNRLRDRLARRGLVPAAALAVAGIPRIAGASLPPGVVARTARTALDFVSHAGPVPDGPRRLAEEVLLAMFTTRIKLAAVTLIALAVPILFAGQLSDPPQKGGEKAGPAPKEPAKPDLAGLERKLHGKWIGRGLIAPLLSVRADGTFRQGLVGQQDHESQGTWSVRWDALPPTLVLTYARSDLAGVAGTTREVKVLRLNDTALEFENPDGLRPIAYTRVKE